MFIDHECEFSLDQVATDAGATEVSTNYYDTSVVAPNLGTGVPITILITISQAFTGTATTLTVTLQDCATFDGSYTNVAGVSTGAIAKALLVPGYQFILTVPPVVTKQYWKLMFTGDNTFQTTGKVTAQVVLDIQSNRSW